MEVLFMPEVLQTVFTFLKDKKALSATCKHFRKVYMQTYKFRPLLLLVNYDDLFSAKICTTCGKSTKTLSFYLTGKRTLCYKNNCRSAACHRQELEASMAMIDGILWGDGLQNRFFSAQNAVAHIKRWAGRQKKTWATQCVNHDIIVNDLLQFIRHKDLPSVIEKCATNAKEHMLLDSRNLLGAIFVSS